MSDDLKSCPFCGSDDLGSGGDDKVVGYWCNSCQAAGPNHYGRYEWNSRADRIEELQARVDELENQKDSLLHTIETWEKRAETLQSRADAAEARVDKLEKDLGCADAYQREWEQHCKTAEARVAQLEKKDYEAATYVESVIAMRTGFTGDPPYVGWKGLGLALNEALDARDAAEARVAELEAERKVDHDNINLKADFIEKTINQLAAEQARAEAAEAKVKALVEALDMWKASFDTAALVDRDHRQADQADAWRATDAALAAIQEAKQ